MELLDNFMKSFGYEKVSKPRMTGKKKIDPNAAYYKESSTGVTWSLSFDGEKNPGELGPAVHYGMDYHRLRIRSWQSYVESDITKTVIDRYLTWVIGTGLRLQAAPNMKVLESEQITGFSDEQKEEFNRTVEARWRTFAESRRSVWNQSKNLEALEKEAYKNAMLGGDCLVVQRYDGDQVSVQIIDGQHVQSPFRQMFWTNGNRIVHGVELDSKGRHVAYHVRIVKPGEAGRQALSFETKRIPVFGRNSKRRMAFMVYGSQYRIDSVRGVPLVATVLETLKKLDRYKEATVGSAEERAKIPYQIIHGLGSTGENPMQERLALAFDPEQPGDIPEDTAGNALADKVAVSTDKMVFNMPVDSKLEALEAKNELYFKDFYDAHFEAVCSAVGIPPNVARMLYNDNYSASRAALKDWALQLNVQRKDFSDQFKKPIYEFWLWTEILKRKVNAPGYQTAWLQGNETAIEAYSAASWIGAQVPHIDPLKEVKAVREMLGPLGKDFPLITGEAACQMLVNGEFDETVQQFAKELTDLDEYDLKPEPVETNQEGQGASGAPAEEE